MKVSVSEIQDQKECLITFSSPIGVGAGKWIGTCAPSVGDVYDVEFDIGCCLEKLNTSKDADQIGIKQGKEETILCGRIEAVDEDGMVFFRMADDFLMMIESESKKFQEGEIVELRIKPSLLEISVIGS